MHDKKPISISVAVVCYNSPLDQIQKLVSSLVNAIEMLKQQVVLAPVSVFFIDNSENDTFLLELFKGERKQLTANEMEIRLIQGHGNIGYGAGHNLALSMLEGEFHLILNPDVVIGVDALLAGISFLQENPDVAVASPYATDADGVKQYLCKRYPSVFTFIIRGFLPELISKMFRKRLARFEMHDLPENEVSTDIPMVSGCFMLSRTDALRKVNGFDEQYFLYFEDFDLSLRIGKLAYVPSMKIIHSGGHAAAKGFRHLRMFALSAKRFFNTYGWRYFHQA